jgi:hypothetical protein
MKVKIDSSFSASHGHHQVISKETIEGKNVICNNIRAYLTGSRAVYRAKKFNRYRLSLKNRYKNLIIDVRYVALNKCDVLCF